MLFKVISFCVNRMNICGFGAVISREIANKILNIINTIPMVMSKEHGEVDALHNELDKLHKEVDSVHGELDLMHAEMDGLHKLVDALHQDVSGKK